MKSSGLGKVNSPRAGKRRGKESGWEKKRKTATGDRRYGECRLASDGDLMLVVTMQTSGKNSDSIKKEAARLVRQLPESASWDDLMYEILVRQKIEAGLADLRDGRKHDHAAIRKEFGIA
jgi:hypothetical protein